MSRNAARIMTHQSLISILAASLRTRSVRPDDSAYYSIMMLDLDRFHEMNLALGRTAGDQLIEETALRLHRIMQSDGNLYRVGDDDFVMVALSKDGSSSEQLLLIQAIHEAFSLPFHIGQVECYMNVSVGVSLVHGRSEELEQAIQEASLALRTAKRLGKNRVCHYDDGLEEVSSERIAMETDLRKAIGSGQLVLHYQPRLELATGKVRCLEALVRWNHPTQGLIPPSEFIPLAEDAGLIAELGNWVLREACEQKKQWLAVGHINSQIAVNISPLQFQDADFADRVIATIEQSGLSPGFIELEITESSIMYDMQKTIEVLDKLCSKGLSISIDDFGIGYSSLSYLKHFPIQCLKIDRSFVKNISVDSSDLAITHAIINLGHSLNLQVVAEGVEEATQLEILKATTCTTIQGYLLSPPRSPLDIEQMFQEQILVS